MMPIPPPVVSVDLETTGLKPSRHQILSLGAVHPNSAKEIYHEVRYPEVRVEPGALRVNGLNVSTLDNDEKLKLREVDKQVAAWLGLHAGGNSDGRLHALGWNVGSFDLQFLNRHMPKTAAHFSYRAIDLNSICFAIDVAHGRELGTTRSLLRTPKPPIPHNALVDAKASIAAFEELCDFIAGVA